MYKECLFNRKGCDLNPHCDLPRGDCVMFLNALKGQPPELVQIIAEFGYNARHKMSMIEVQKILVLACAFGAQE